MTIPQARKILGSSYDTYPDDIIENYIKTAEMFVELFYESINEEQTTSLCNNKLNAGN